MKPDVLAEARQAAGRAWEQWALRNSCPECGLCIPEAADGVLKGQPHCHFLLLRHLQFCEAGRRQATSFQGDSP